MVNGPNSRDPTATDQTAAYTAVIYFHGMGSQRRFEEASRLIEELDERGHEAKEKLFNVTCHIEPSRVKRGDKVQYVRTVFGKTAEPTPRTSRLVHFYEGYWAPITAKEVKFRTVLYWLIRQTFRPYQMLFCNWSTQKRNADADTRAKSVFPSVDWRGHARLRRSALRELAALHKSLDTVPCRSKWTSISSLHGRVIQAKVSARIQPGDVHFLLRAYRSFEGLEARRKYRGGSFRDFREFLIARLNFLLPANDAGRERIPLIADAWRRYCAVSEIRNAAILTTLLLMIVLGCLGGLFLASNVLSMINGPKSLTLLKWFLPPAASGYFSSTTAAMILSLFLTLLGFQGFMTRYLGDVVFWCTYEETDVRFKKRREILDYGLKTVKHVLNDVNCQRIVVIAHSLGTAIAHDVLLELGKEDWARSHNKKGFQLVDTYDLNKIEHFITAGSPIDKIHYFFESHPGRSHRYTRVSESIRGDMGRKPFGNNNNRPFLHWINFWDEADIFSGPLESPPNATDTDVHVDNVEVSNGTIFPVRAHTTYFHNNTVREYLFNIIYHNAYSYRWVSERAPEGPGNRDYGAENLGVGSGRKHVRLVQIVVLFTPWITLVVVLFHFWRVSR